MLQTEPPTHKELVMRGYEYAVVEGGYCRLRAGRAAVEAPWVRSSRLILETVRVGWRRTSPIATWICAGSVHERHYAVDEARLVRSRNIATASGYLLR